MHLRLSYASRNFAVMSNQTDFINAVEAAAILHISVRAVQHRIAAGTLAAQKLPGKTGAYILNRADVDAAATSAVA